MAAGKIAGITIEIGGETTKLKSALKSVDSDIKKTQESLKDVNKLLKLDPSNTELLTQKQRLLGKEIEETKSRLTTLKDAAANVTPEDIGQEKYDALQREIEETEQKLKSLEEQSAKSASVLGSQMQEAGEQLKKVGESVTSVGKDLTTKLTLPLAAVGAAGVKSFADVDKTMQLTNATMKNSEKQAELLNKAMKDAAANSTFGMTDAANASLNFARAGLTAKEAAAALAPAMNLAAGEGGNLDTVSGGLVATINGFHGSFDEASHYADVFAAACNNSALDVDSLSGAMSVAAPIFSAAGYSVNDAALYMGVMANNAIEADKAANSLKTGLARLVSPAKEGAEMMAKLGFSVTDADGNMKDSITIQKELHDAFGNLSEAEQIAAASAIFGKNQMAPWLALINTAPEDVGKLNDSLDKAAGTTDKMANAMMSGFGGSIEKLKSSIDVLVTSIGEALAPTILSVTNFIQQLVDKFNTLTPAQQQTIAKIGLAVAAIGPLLVAIGTVISVIGTVVGAIGTAITTVSAVIGVLSAGGGAAAAFGAAVAALGGPVTVITGIIVGLVAAGALVIANWDKIKAAASTVWNAIKTAVTNACKGLQTALTGAMTAIQTTMSNVWSAISKKVTEVWDTIKNVVNVGIMFLKELLTAAFLLLTLPWQFIWQNFGDTIKAAWDTIKTVISTALTAISNAIKTAWNTINTVISAALTAIGNAIKTAWTAISTTIKTVLNAIKTNVQTVWNAIKSVIQTAVNAIKTVVTTAWNAIKSTIQTVMNAIKSVITAAWNAISSTVSSAVGRVKGIVTPGFNAVKSTISNTMNAAKSAVSTAWSGITSVVGNAVGNVKSKISSGFNAAKATVSSIFGSIKDKIKSVMDSAKDAVSSAIDKIKSKFHFSWSLPHLKLPHISISGHFSINPPSAPHFSIDWRKTAMENGMIFTNPTIFGMMNGRLQGAGDAGPEAMIGVSSLERKIRDAVASVGTNDPSVIYAAVKAGMENANIGIYIGERQFGRLLRGQGVTM